MFDYSNLICNIFSNNSGASSQDPKSPTLSLITVRSSGQNYLKKVKNKRKKKLEQQKIRDNCFLTALFSATFLKLSVYKNKLLNKKCTLHL